MKKNYDCRRITMFIFLIFLASSNICFAGVDLRTLSIGGVSTSSKEEYVKNIYGEPDRIVSDDYGHVGYYYGDFFIKFYEPAMGRAFEITTAGDNGLVTERGLSVGSDESLIIQLYGDPDSEWIDYDGRVCPSLNSFFQQHGRRKVDTIKKNEDGSTIYKYFTSMAETSFFVTVKNKKVIKISILCNCP